jgi:hypothetical protein
MHIHGGQLNSHVAAGAAHASEAALAARRAEATRKKLLASASELDALNSSDSSWMIQAWAGGNTPANQNAHGSQGQAENSPAPDSSPELPPVSRTAPSGPVSFWV